MNIQNNVKQLPVMWYMLLFLFQTVLVSSAITHASELTAEFNEDGILVSDNGLPVLQYQLKTKSRDGTYPRANYVHPLYDLQGAVITEDFPDDHRHHRGIFWTWHQVWVADRQLGDPWACKDFGWVMRGRGTKCHKDGSVVASASIDWQSPLLADSDGTPIAIVNETTQITVHPATPDHRCIDFTIRLRALLSDVRIGGSDDQKGYGGFSPRIRLSPEQKFVAEGGEIEPQKTAIHAGPWLDISNENDGVAIITHPANPGFPEPWILRRNRSMQNAVFPGREPVPLPTDKPVVLKYRLVIHRGSAAHVSLGDLQRQFATH